MAGNLALTEQFRFDALAGVCTSSLVLIRVWLLEAQAYKRTCQLLSMFDFGAKLRR